MRDGKAELSRAREPSLFLIGSIQFVDLAETRRVACSGVADERTAGLLLARIFSGRWWNDSMFGFIGDIAQIIK